MSNPKTAFYGLQFLLTPEVYLILQEVKDCHILPVFLLLTPLSSSLGESPQICSRGVFFIVFILFYIHVFIQVRTHTIVHMWRSEDNLWGTFHNVESEELNSDH